MNAVRGPRYAVAGRHRRGPVPLPAALKSAHAIYVAELAQAPLSPESRRTYASKVRQYLVWLDSWLHATDAGGDPLSDPAVRDRAVREWRTHLVTVAGLAPASINNALSAVDDLYIRRGMGRAAAQRVDVTAPPPRALDEQAQLCWLRAVEAHPSARDRALAAIPFYAGARIAETVRLDIGDVEIRGTAGLLRIRNHGGSVGTRIREVPVHPKLRDDLRRWLTERADWPGARSTPALFLNHRGSRLTVRGARDIIARIAAAAGQSDAVTAHVLRHTFGTNLVRGGTDLVLVAELLGHARLETTRSYTEPSATDRTEALRLLPEPGGTSRRGARDRRS
ncbi:tyrosine-type recombinase/integrase [Actinopolymorpha sp. B17G11]|uniref:tyrosine-type recombinase/integrase n=1 Tax=Actinopolymorpha sp. B17G11 TaxID=3160861 RepID=UPI0032E3B21C